MKKQAVKLAVIFRNSDVGYTLFTFKGMTVFGYCCRFSNLLFFIAVVCYVVAVGIDRVCDQESNGQQQKSLATLH